MPNEGFLASLFDVSFSSLVTTRVIKFLYVLSMILIGLVALAFIVVAFSNSVATGVITLFVIAPLISLLYLVYVRVLLEIVIVIFRIMETNVELVAIQRGRPAAPPTSPPPASPPPPSVPPSSPQTSPPPASPPPAPPPPTS